MEVSCAFLLCIENMSVVTFTGSQQLHYKATKQFGDAILSLETRMNGCFDLNECIYIVCRGKSLHNIGCRVKNLTEHTRLKPTQLLRFLVSFCFYLFNIVLLLLFIFFFFFFTNIQLWPLSRYILNE